jgi:hypothetical protein
VLLRYLDSQELSMVVFNLEWENFFDGKRDIDLVVK